MQDDEMKNALSRIKDLTLLETRAIAAETQVLTTEVSQGTRDILQHVTKIFENATEVSANTSSISGLLEQLIESMFSSRALQSMTLRPLNRLKARRRSIIEGN